MIDSHANAARWSVDQTIIVAGLVAAIVEMLVVIPVQSALGVTPLVLFQSIASGWQGSAAYQGGLGSAFLGVGLHLAISIVAAGLFVHASRLWPILVWRSLSAGLIYGALAYLVMTYLVIPLSAADFKPATDTPLVATSVGVHLFCFGLPIALVTRYGTARSRFS